MLVLKRIAVGVVAFFTGVVVAALPYESQKSSYRAENRAEVYESVASEDPRTVTATVEADDVVETTVTVEPEPLKKGWREAAEEAEQNREGDGGGYVGSDAYLRQKLCSELHPGFAQTDQRDACVQSGP